MAYNLMPFDQPSTMASRTVFYCPNCDSRSFKIVMAPSREEILVECANCEELQTWVQAELIPEDYVIEEEQVT